LLKNATGHNSPDVNYHRTSLDMEQEAEDALKDWLVENHEEAILDCFYDKFPYFVIADSIISASATAHPRTYYAGGVSSAASMDPAYVLNAREAQRMRSYAINRRLNPIKVDGKKAFVVLADTFCLNDLKNDPVFSAQQNANDRGSDNPLVSGAIGSYNNLYFHEYERMRRTTSGAHAGNIGQIALLGADAIAMAYGSEPRLVPRTETSYGDRWGRAIRQVFGGVRTDFVDQSLTATINQSSAQWNVWEVQDEFAQ
jgi:N4-gp56 family major capsid protein